MWHAEHECKLRGAQRMAYPSVVGAGPSATIIHYGDNDQVRWLPLRLPPADTLYWVHGNEMDCGEMISFVGP